MQSSVEALVPQEPPKPLICISVESPKQDRYSCDMLTGHAVHTVKCLDSKSGINIRNVNLYFRDYFQGQSGCYVNWGDGLRDQKKDLIQVLYHSQPTYAMLQCTCQDSTALGRNSKDACLASHTCTFSLCMCMRSLHSTGCRKRRPTY